MLVQMRRSEEEDEENSTSVESTFSIIPLRSRSVNVGRVLVLDNPPQ
jgi:hypothetical protein